MARRVTPGAVAAIGTSPRAGRFEHGRHETFAPRYGWLSKGLARMAADPAGFAGDLASAEALGIGSRMAKSLRYWLEATGLGEAPGEGRGPGLVPTEAGRAILELDPYMERPVTWWVAHVALASRQRSVFGWFFGGAMPHRFDRKTCVSEFTGAVERAGNTPSPGSIQRDVACLLSAYSAPPPPAAPSDPEDVAASPFAELGLIVDTGDAFRIQEPPPGSLPLEAFMCSAEAVALRLGRGSVSMGELAAGRPGPGPMFCLPASRLELLAEQAAARFPSLGITVSRLGAERHLGIPTALGSAGWLRAGITSRGDMA